MTTLFNHPSTRIEFVMNDLGVSRITAIRYLDQLANCGLVEKSRIGKGSYYINRPLFALLSSEP